jgi:hypothetical protein
MIQWHGFSKFADQFHHIGTVSQETNKRGEPITRYIVDAQIENLDTGKISLGSIVWAVDQNGFCYHRMFEDVWPRNLQQRTQAIGLQRLNTDLFTQANNPLRVVENGGTIISHVGLRKISINDPKLHARIHLYGVMPKTVPAPVQQPKQTSSSSSSSNTTQPK